jgi:hypothetical protein
VCTCCCTPPWNRHQRCPFHLEQSTVCCKRGWPPVLVTPLAGGGWRLATGQVATGRWTETESEFSVGRASA